MTRSRLGLLPLEDRSVPAVLPVSPAALHGAAVEYVPPGRTPSSGSSGTRPTAA